MSELPSIPNLQLLTIDATTSTEQLVETRSDWWSDLSPTRKRAILIGAPLLAIIIPLTILLAFFLSPIPVCSFEDKVPLLDAPGAVYTQPDAKNMIKLSGYISVPGSGYLPINIKRMRFNPVENSLVLRDNCIKLTIYYRPQIQNSVDITHIKWALEGLPGHVTQPYWLCRPTVPEFAFKFPVSKYYLCHTRQTYGCQWKDEMGYIRTVGELVIESFELEINGTSSIISKGKFSKQPSYCEV